MKIFNKINIKVKNPKNAEIVFKIGNFLFSSLILLSVSLFVSSFSLFLKNRELKIKLNIIKIASTTIIAIIYFEFNSIILVDLRIAKAIISKGTKREENPNKNFISLSINIVKTFLIVFIKLS